jgi:formylglycine-generating enzyme required for sulfatase activity
MHDDPSEEPAPPDTAPTLHESGPSPGEPGATTAPKAVEVDSIVSGELVRRLSERRESSTRYMRQGEVATGGMGAILKVWDEDLRRSLAMKVVLDFGDDGQSEKALARFVEEAQITGQLEHPGIVPVHEVGLDDSGRMYFTMQLVRGRDLEKIFERVHAGSDEDWTPTRAVHALLKVCDAMAYAHSKGVIHRDLKPANVMVGRFGEVYVMDWGLARILGHESVTDVRPTGESDEMRSLEIQSDRDDVRGAAEGSALLTMDGDIMGTPAYMSPEQARGDLDAMGPTSDVYSVGAILYHLLSGHVPYNPPEKALNALTVWGLVQAGAPQPIHERAPEAPAELCAICEKAMAREQPERYATMDELARDLRSYLEGRVVAAYETGAVAEFRKWVRRNKALALTGLVAGLVIVSGLSVASIVLAGKNRALSDVTARAVENATLADERASKVLRLADVKRLQQLQAEAGALWPAHPEQIPALRDWIERADELVAREPTHAAELARLEDSGIDNTEDLWQRDTLVELTADLASVNEPERGLLADVLARLAFAESVEERTRTGTEAMRRWAVATASIQNTEQSPLYDGLELPPQLGLLPIGQDRQSGLWEFAHLQTGAEAVRDETTGRLVLKDSTGLVFVLIPGGSFFMGSQSLYPNEPHYASEASDTETPLHEVTLTPFFLSKYELTQAQWMRFTGENPSNYGIGKEFLGRFVGGTNPVEQVNLDECTEVLTKLGLRVPTEAQWERAARGGTTSAWWTGAERDTLRGRANLADQAAAEAGAQWKYISDWPTFYDGYVVHAPVDEFAPNPFGLHHVHGNVWEWCRDNYIGDYTPDVRAGDGERLTPPSDFNIARGGSFYHSANLARSAYRNPTSPNSSVNNVGVRPARDLD